jgi:flavin-dependent dehydrogenase
VSNGKDGDKRLAAAPSANQGRCVVGATGVERALSRRAGMTGPKPDELLVEVIDAKADRI